MAASSVGEDGVDADVVGTEDDFEFLLLHDLPGTPAHARHWCLSAAQPVAI